MIHRVPYNEGAYTLVHVPPVQAATATYSIEDLWVDDGGADRVLASGSATVDSASEVLTAAAGPATADRHKLTVADTSGFTVGRRYWLSEDSSGEEFIVERITSNTAIYTRDSIMGDYTTSALAIGLEMSATFPAANANDEDNVTGERPFRVVWEYDVHGYKRKVQEQIRVVRYTDSDVDAAEALNFAKGLFPELADMVASPSTLTTWAALCARMLRNDLVSKSQDPEEFLTGDRGTEALAYKICALAASNGFAPSHTNPIDFGEDMRRHLTGVWQSLTRGQAGRETVDLSKNDQAEGSHSRKPRAGVFTGL